MSVPGELYTLLERFERDRDSYRSGRYNEAQARVDFINPLLGLLGWDVENRQGRPEAYRDVVYEDRVKVGGGTKAPDYGFYADGRRRFFLEAKKPSVDIAGDLAPAVQLRRYAWSARLPLSLLTDFEEFAIYDCRSEPQKDDSAATARLELFTYDRYADEAVWDRISSVFSREAVLDGSLERYADENRKRRGTETVDAAFLREIEGWRSALARDIASRNALNTRGLNFAVQMTIDRIIFLRMAEDRGIEDYGRLMALLNGGDTYRRLCEIFRDADDRYNSGLFHFRSERGRDEEPDRLTPAIDIDDTVLKGIIRGLYYPESPYEFSVLPVDVLGQVYEQFLGRVIRLEDGHTATVEEKPEVRKAGGVYYTPTYIVDYIVEKTVGKLLEGKRPGPRGGASRIKIVDPACGSGSFLIGAYQYLLDWHRDRYVEDGPEKWSKVLYEGHGGQHHLTIDEKKRILLNNIYGVDIDPQAVEVTKLSLLLKVLEGESEASLATQLRMFQERALPDLDDNIKCGNSLMGPDFYDNEQMMLLDEEEHYRINVFDWKESFPHIFEGDNPGFDAVIGNPPYVRIQRIAHHEADYLFKHYITPASKTDLSQLFLERSLEICAQRGQVGFISTSQWMATDYGRNMREHLSDGILHEIVDFGSLPVFERADTYPGIFILSPRRASNLELKRIEANDQLNLVGVKNAPVVSVPFDTLGLEPWNLGLLNITSVLERGSRTWTDLRSLGRAYIGALTGMDAVFVLTADAAEHLGLEDDFLFPYAYRGGEVERYSKINPHARAIYPYREGPEGVPQLIGEPELEEAAPRIFAYLTAHKHNLQQRKDSRKLYAAENWYRYLRPGSFNYVRPEKFVVKGIDTRSSIGLLQGDTLFNGANCPGIIFSDLRGHSSSYMLALLNSRVVSYYLRMVCPAKLGGYTRFNASNINNAPISIIDFSDPEDVARHDRMVELVERMLELHERLAGARIERERTVIGHQISATDRQIDRLVYELYGLTDEEIRIVEDATER